MTTRTRKVLETLAIGEYYELPETDPTWQAMNHMKPKRFTAGLYFNGVAVNRKASSQKEMEMFFNKRTRRITRIA